MKDKDKQGDIFDMNAIAMRTGQDIKDMAAALAAYPSPDKWTSQQKAQAVQFAALLDTAQRMIGAASLAGIDWQAEKAIFLTVAGKTKSPHTWTAYGYSLERLDAWAAAGGINPLELTPAQADDFLTYLRNLGNRAAASIRLDAAACSSFFTWLHRRHPAIDNPFRGTKERPGKKTEKETVIPGTPGELKTILASLPPYESAAAAVMALRGLRAGGLPGMKISGNRFTTRTKGKDFTGEIPAAVLRAIEIAGLPLREPFKGIKPNTLEKRIARSIEKMYKTGKVKAPYSCHDLRHYYAVHEYRKDKDIHRLCKLLGHASIQVTETYLKGLGEYE